MKGELKFATRIASDAESGVEHRWITKTVFSRSTEEVETIEKLGNGCEFRKTRLFECWNAIREEELTTTETWDEFKMTYTERRFFERQTVPSGHILLPQFAVKTLYWKTQAQNIRFVDFMLVRKKDLKPIVGFEIDGASHDGMMVMDALRDIEVQKELGCSIVHVAAAKLQNKTMHAYVENSVR